MRKLPKISKREQELIRQTASYKMIKAVMDARYGNAPYNLIKDIVKISNIIRYSVTEEEQEKMPEDRT